MNARTLLRQQLDARNQAFRGVLNIVLPPIGWIKATRRALGISSEQLGKKLSVSRQAIADMESREKEGAITLKALKAAADAMDMQLVYAFVPKDGSLEALIDRKARELATKIVARTSTNMKLEDQGNSAERIAKAIEERTASIKAEMPKALWD